jgi:hypothetical protein
MPHTTKKSKKPKYGGFINASFNAKVKALQRSLKKKRAPSKVRGRPRKYWTGSARRRAVNSAGRKKRASRAKRSSYKKRSCRSSTKMRNPKTGRCVLLTRMHLAK